MLAGSGTQRIVPSLEASVLLRRDFTARTQLHEGLSAAYVPKQVTSGRQPYRPQGKFFCKCRPLAALGMSCGSWIGRSVDLPSLLGKLTELSARFGGRAVFARHSLLGPRADSRAGRCLTARTGARSFVRVYPPLSGYARPRS